MARFIICRASAGSGKTYTLVRQYIEIAIACENEVKTRFEHILAITFTNKAANGMKERIMSTLKKIAFFAGGDNKTEKLIGEISKDLGIGFNEVMDRCKTLQRAILHDYSNFSVCTIDSFVHRIVRTFSHDLNLPMNFDLAIDNEEILQSTVDELMSLAGREGEEALTRVLCSFAESRMENGSNYRLDARIVEMSKEIFKEETPAFLKELKNLSFDDFLTIHGKLVEMNSEYETSVEKAADCFIKACDDVGLKMDDFPNKNTSVYAFMLRLSRGDLSKLSVPHVRVDNAYESGQLYGKSTLKEAREKMEGVTDLFCKAYETMDGGLIMYNTRKMILSSLFGLALLNKMSQLKNEFYAEKETVHISEFNKRIAEEIANEPAPFIYERIGTRYSNYLIDEFQDTSKLQWQNFLPLIDEAMTWRFGPDTAEAGCRSMVVGDGKQAIYRFRQGDVRQFMMLPHVDSTLHGASLLKNSEVLPLDVNYRTKSTVVTFNNNFFKYVINDRFGNTNPELNKLYIGEGGADKPELWQHYKHEGGYVEVDFCEMEDVYECVRQTILQQVNEKHYSYGDIMILARRNDTLVEIADFFNSSDTPIPIVSSESFLLKNSDVVKLIVSLLSYMSDTKDHVAAVNSAILAARLGIKGAVIPAEQVAWELEKCGFDLSRMFKSFGIDFNVDYFRTLSHYDAVEQLLRLFDLKGRDTAYVATLLDCINNFAPHGRADLVALVDYLKKKMDVLSSSTSSDMDAVKLLTVHKAKGLEEKIVIYVMTLKTDKQQKMWVHLSDGAGVGLPVTYVTPQKKKKTSVEDVFADEFRMEDMDRINVFYVAMTRPEDKLFVVCKDDWNADGMDNISLLHSFVARESGEAHMHEAYFDLGTKYTVGDDGVYVPEDEESESKKKDVSVDSVIFPPWENRLDIAAKSESLLSPLESDKRRFGILIHDMMSKIIVPSDIDRVVSEYCKSNNLDHQAESLIASRIRKAVEKEENQRFFDSRYKVACEVDISINSKHTRRPDRIVFADDETWVVDFKTGEYSEEQNTEYEDQVAQYVALIKVMGYPNVSGKVIYI